MPPERRGGYRWPLRSDETDPATSSATSSEPARPIDDEAGSSVRWGLQREEVLETIEEAIRADVDRTITGLISDGWSPAGAADVVCAYWQSWLQERVVKHVHDALEGDC
jgi:hypothetical protein